MKFTETDLPGVIIVEPSVFEDERGFFMETYQAARFAEAGIAERFVQDNHSHSRKGTLRGMHYQVQHAQGKLVRVVSGEIFDAVLDLRRASTTFGKWTGSILSAKNKQQRWAPAGFAHGFYVLSDQADVLYRVTDYYDPQAERCIRWDDPDVGIAWPLDGSTPPILSARDRAGKRLAEAEVYP